jgi:hypothetical protein
MKKVIWRVAWKVDQYEGPPQTLDFSSEENAIGWAEGIQSAGGEGIVVTELIVGRTIRFDCKIPIFEK